MISPEPINTVVSREEQLADLAALKEAARHRHSFGRWSPDWQAALVVEQAAIERVRRWSERGAGPHHG